MISLGGILGIVAPIFLILLLGFGLRRVGVLTEESDRSLLGLVVNVLLPCLILEVIIGNEALLEPRNLIVPPLLGMGFVLLGYAVAWPLAGVFGLRGRAARGAFTFCVAVQNYGYIPLPIILALFGRETAAVLFGFSLGVEIAFWGVGILILNRPQGRAWRRIVNVPILSIIVAVTLNLVGAAAWIPVWVDTTWTMLGACAVPLALLLTGAVFADFAYPRHLFAEKRGVVLAIALRLGLFPVLMLLAARYLPLDEQLRIVLAVQAAMPAAVAPLAIAKHYGGDVPTALRVVLSTTLLGLVTIPLWLRFGFWFVLY